MTDRALEHVYSASLHFLPRQWFSRSTSADAARARKLRRAGEEDSYYLQDTWRTAHTAHSGLTGEAIGSPRAAFTWSLRENWTVRAGADQYAQFPGFEQLFGFFGNRQLKAERATHLNVNVERRLGIRTRITAEF